MVRDAKVTIGGKLIDYRVTAGKLRIEKGKAPVRADMFYVSYERTGLQSTLERPVMFAFNGGPGSSSVWLHIGMLGPRILDVPGDGTSAPEPPVRFRDNPHSLLDVCDLVFIDPVSTGYSRAEDEKKSGDFHGLNDDIESVGEFIRRWITQHDRWGSPKYLLGESYGGIRGVGLAKHLQSRHGMSLNGLVMLSSLMDFNTLRATEGNDVSHFVFLPAYTAAAHHHGRIQGERDALLKQSASFAFGDYAAALVRGSSLDDGERRTVAGRLAELTGIDAATWEAEHLRIDPFRFRAELLADQGLTIGRFDARVAWPSTDKTSPYPDYDPSYSLAQGAFTTALMDYLGREIGYKEDQPYEILTGKVHPWDWDSENRIVNVSDRLLSAMRDNPKLRVLVMCGHLDLATPPENMAYSLRHMLDLPDQARQRIDTVFYDAGHMFYLNPPDLEKSRQDLLRFIK